MLKVVVRALRSLVGDETAILHSLVEHRNRANFHMLCPELTIDCRTVARIQGRQSAMLISDE